MRSSGHRPVSVFPTAVFCPFATSFRLSVAGTFVRGGGA